MIKKPTKEGLREVCRLAGELFGPTGVNVTGAHYFVPEGSQTLQKKCRGIYLCFDGTTRNLSLLGKDYDNRRRLKLIDLAYEVAGNAMDKLFPGQEICLDVYVQPEKPYFEDESAFACAALEDGSVDVNTDNNVAFVKLKSLMQSGEVEAGSTFHKYCERYHLEHVLRHGWHYISPDSSSVEAFEAICRTKKVNSVLEIGAGVGICGAAARMLGIEDFTFVDSNPVVCQYLEEKFPYKTVPADAFSFDFNRHWDVILVGIPYELNPWFLARRGLELARCCETVVFQSGSTAFFEFEHDWILGSKKLATWPWWEKEQTVGFYFPHLMEAALDWQTCIVATQDIGSLIRINNTMRRNGFSLVKYERV